VELFANGVSLGVKEAADHFFYFDVPNVGETHLVAVAGELKDEGDIRKVDKFNEDYRLREKTAILNWFDITEVEGHLSLNDKMSDIMATVRGKLILAGLMMKFMPKGDDKKSVMGGFELNDSMMQMLGSFTVLRLLGMAGGMLGIEMSKEELLEMNAKLNKIKKPKK
jgi:beta-galactosidase